MEQLLELEKRVLDIIQKNKDLRQKNEGLKAETVRLKSQCEQLEKSLLDSGENRKAFDEEKVALKTAIEDLLEGINSIESPEQVP